MIVSTQDRLKQHGVEVDFLPGIAEIFPIRLREPSELARRTLALHALLGVIFHPDPREIAEWMRAENFLQELTERERWAFSLTELPEDEMLWRQEAMQSNLLTWRAESLYVLLWASGKIPDLADPGERMDGSLVGGHLPALGEPLQPFIRDAGLRPSEEILAELHYYFFLNHFMEDIHEQTGEIIGDLEPFLTSERFHALHWITCADQSEWDADEE
ncbi:DUF4272 domain-containing protein [Nocardia sienata]|uniref:DUF4272 domain-containing protein n=1 Tax=Nocardia sienata TaxID=248552 RepID=UPI0007A56633|nr:DUF4272 domain-containing protein [Nocardia sienata]